MYLHSSLYRLASSTSSSLSTSESIISKIVQLFKPITYESWFFPHSRPEVMISVLKQYEEKYNVSCFDCDFDIQTPSYSTFLPILSGLAFSRISVNSKLTLEYTLQITITFSVETEPLGTGRRPIFVRISEISLNSSFFVSSWSSRSRS
jgi:hypothetical protein